MPKRTYFIAADSGREREHWIEMIEKQVQLVREQMENGTLGRHQSMSLGDSEDDSDDGGVELDERGSVKLDGKLQLSLDGGDYSAAAGATGADAVGDNLSPAVAALAMADDPVANGTGSSVNAATAAEGDTQAQAEEADTIGAVPLRSDNTRSLLMKVVLMGKQGTGKTQLRNILSDQPFKEPCASTKGIDFVVTFMESAGRRIKVQVWEGGADIEKGRKSIVKALLKGAAVVVLCYDVHSRASLDHCIEVLLPIVMEQTEGQSTVLLLGTREDATGPYLDEGLEAVEGDAAVNEAQARSTADAHGVRFVGATSSKDRGDDARQLIVAAVQTTIHDRVMSRPEGW